MDSDSGIRSEGAAAPLSRRALLAAAAGSASLLGLPLAAGVEDPSGGGKATRGRIRQSIVHWCFNKHWDVEETCRVAVSLGVKSVELVPPDTWHVLKKHGLVCALAGSHGFEKGMNNPAYQPMCIEKIRQAIDACATHGFPSVITFTGFREGISDEAGLENCVEGYKRVIGYAEEKKVNLCLEMLNSRVAEEMKGHPGYQGDHVAYCMEIIQKVGSPRLKLLFDIYHVQIMDGDII